MRTQAVIGNTISRREKVLRWQWLISDVALATGAVGFAVLYYLILFA